MKNISDECVDCGKNRTTYDPVTIMTLTHLEAGSIQGAINEYLDHKEIIDDFQCYDVEGNPNGCVTKQVTRSVSVHTYPNVLRVVLARYY